MKPPKRPYSLEGSTDIGGASPWNAVHLWKRYHHLIDGLEVIAWRWSTRQFLQSQENSPVLRLTRLHGPLLAHDQPRHFSRINLYDQSLMADRPLITTANSFSLDVLVHAPHAGNGFARSLTGLPIPKNIWVENHHGEAGLKEAETTIAMLQAQGLPVRLMLDLAHYSMPWKPGFTGRFAKMILHLARLTGKIELGVHLPIGDQVGDSLNLFNDPRLTDAMLTELASVLQGVKAVVLEYQSPLFTYTLPLSIRKKQVWPRLDRIMDRLQRVGIA